MKILSITLWILHYSTTGLSLKVKVKDNAESALKQIAIVINNSNASKPVGIKHYDIGKISDESIIANKNAYDKADVPKQSQPFQFEKKKNRTSRTVYEPNVATEHPWLQRRVDNPIPYRRQYKYKDAQTDSERESSTSSEMNHWREEFDLDWVNKKMMAIKERFNMSGAITINMAGGRPWGIPCGDPNQHDLPWGSCVLPYECDGEFRIYRGDVACGRSKFVCCAVMNTQHDLYQAIDMSFIHTSLSSSSHERLKRKRGSKEDKHKKKVRQIYKRRKRRLRLKRAIKKLIRKVARQVRKSLNRAFRNSTGERRDKTVKLKQEIKKMKKKFYLDRKIAMNIHDFDIQKIDQDIKYKLNYVRQVNHDFLMNDTFRELILHGNTTGLRMLLINIPGPDDFPVQRKMLPVNSSYPNRRSGNHKIRKKKRKRRKKKDYLEYDIEYGALYY